MSPRCCVKTGNEKNNDTARNPISFFMPPPILIVLHMFADPSPSFHRRLKAPDKRGWIFGNCGPDLLYQLGRVYSNCWELLS